MPENHQNDDKARSFMTLNNGAMIGHYRIIEKIGAGGMGEVYLAEDPELNRKVALKFLPADLCRDADCRARFKREAQAAAKLSHPNIITIYEISEYQSRPFFAMELIEGDSLADFLKKNDHSIEKVIDLAIQICEGLDKAHQAGIVHRDLKPSNILVDHDGRVHIVDFGLAAIKGVDRLTKNGTTSGTLPYMSPEQTRGEELDQRSDIFSLGVVLYEMVTGRLPFTGDYDPAIIYSIGCEEPAPMMQYEAGIPDGLQEIVGTMLAKQPDQRYQATRALSDDLKRVLAGEVPTVIATSRRRRRIRRAALVAGLVFLIAFGYWITTAIMAPRTPQAGRNMLAVLPFAVVGQKTDLNDWPEIIQTLIANDLTGASEWGIVDPLSLNTLIDDRYDSLNPPRDSRLYGLVQKKGIAYLIDGTIMGIGGKVTINAGIVDTKTGDRTSLGQEEITGEADLPRAVGNLSRNVFDFLQAQVLRSGYDNDLGPWTSHRSMNLKAIRAFMQAGQFIFNGAPGSEKFLRRAVEEDSLFVAPRIWLISGLVQQGKTAEADSQYQTLLRREPEANSFEQAMIDWAGAFISGDKRAQAAALRVALTYSPANNILLYQLGRTLFELSDHQGVIEALSPAIEMRWKYSPAYYLVGASQCAIKDFEGAKKTLETSLTLPPVFPYTYGLLSAIVYHQGDSLAALKYEDLFVSEIKEHQVPLWQIYAMLGENYMNIGTCSGAIRYYQMAVSLNSQDAGNHANLGEALYRLGRIDQAEKEYHLAISLDSTMAFPYRMLGEIYEHRGDTAEAASYYRAYIARDSTGDEATEIMRRLAQLGK